MIKDNFYYSPELMPWSPTEVARRLPLETMFKAAEIAQTRIDAQLDALAKTKAGVYEIDAYLDQDKDYKAKKLAEIATKSTEFSEKNLLDRTIQSELRTYIDQLTYDSNLESVSNRTAAIRDAWKNYNEAAAKGETSYANIRPMIKSIEEANKAFKDTGEFNDKVSVDSTLRPFVNVSKTMLESIKTIEPSTLPMPDGNSFTIVDIGNGYNMVTSLEGKSAERIMNAAMFALGGNGMAQLKLEYDFLKEDSPETLTKPNKSLQTFEEYVAQILETAGQAFSSQTVKMGSVMEDLNAKRAHERQMQKNDHAFRYQLELIKEANQAKKEKEAAAKTVVTIAGPAQQSADITKKVAGVFKEATAAERAMDNLGLKNSKGENLTPSQIIQSEQAFINSGRDWKIFSTATRSLGLNDETIKNMFSEMMLRDPEKTDKINEVVKNYTDAKQRKNAAEQLFGGTAEMQEIYNAAEVIAQENIRNKELSWFNWDRQKNRNKDQAFLSTIGNPEGDTAEEVLENIMSKKQGSSRFDDNVKKINEKIKKAEGGLHAIDLSTVVGSSDGATSLAKYLNSVANMAKIATLNYDGAPVTKFVDAKGTAVIINGTAKVTGATLQITNNKVMYNMEVSQGNNTGYMLADISSASTPGVITQLKGILDNALSSDNPDAAQVEMAVKGLGILNNSANNFSIIGATNYKTFTKEYKTVSAANHVAVKPVVEVGVPISIYGSNNTVEKAQIYYDSLADHFFIGLNVEDTIITIPLDRQYKPNSTGTIYYKTAEQALVALGALENTN